MSGVAGGFTAGEKAAVVARDLVGGSANYGQDGYDNDMISGSPVEGALLWPLSVAEAGKLNSELRKADPAKHVNPLAITVVRGLTCLVGEVRPYCNKLIN